MATADKKGISSTLRMELSPAEHVLPDAPKSCADAKTTWNRLCQAEKTKTVRLKMGPDGEIVECLPPKKTAIPVVKQAIPLDRDLGM